MMNTNFKATGAVMLTDELRSYVLDKLERVEKLLDPDDSLLRAEIELATVSGSRTGNMFRAEVNLTFTGGFVRAEATAEALHSAIDDCVDELRREVRKTKTKHRDLVRKGASRVKDFFKYFRGN